LLAILSTHEVSSDDIVYTDYTYTTYINQGKTTSLALSQPASTRAATPEFFRSLFSQASALL
jgi:hypothetical protein